MHPAYMQPPGAGLGPNPCHGAPQVATPPRGSDRLHLLASVPPGFPAPCSPHKGMQGVLARELGQSTGTRGIHGENNEDVEDGEELET